MWTDVDYMDEVSDLLCGRDNGCFVVVVVAVDYQLLA